MGGLRRRLGRTYFENGKGTGTRLVIANTGAEALKGLTGTHMVFPPRAWAEHRKSPPPMGDK